MMWQLPIGPGTFLVFPAVVCFLRTQAVNLPLPNDLCSAQQEYQTQAAWYALDRAALKRGVTTGADKVPMIEKGSFPLDHDNECGSAMEEYMTCLKDNSYISANCEAVKKVYLDCRMKTWVSHWSLLAWNHTDLLRRGLMAEEDMGNLGLRDDEEMKQLGVQKSQRKREKQGFVAGMSRVEGKEIASTK